VDYDKVNVNQEVRMIKKAFGQMLQSTFVIIVIAGGYFLFSDFIQPAKANLGWTCPAVLECTASGCTGSVRKKCTYTGPGCPSEAWCQYRF